MRSFAALMLAAMTACYAPTLTPCSVHCDGTAACPADLECGADHHCHEVGDTAVCARDFIVTVRKSGTGDGLISSDRTIDCGPVCSMTVAPGDAVTLMAMATSGSHFTGWSGVCSGSGTCPLTVNADTTVSAGFNRSVSLAVAFLGAGGGRVISSVPGLDCTSDCTVDFDATTTVTLTAVADGGSTFIEWGGACQGQDCTVTLDASLAVTARFE